MKSVIRTICFAFFLLFINFFEGVYEKFGSAYASQTNILEVIVQGAQRIDPETIISFGQFELGEQLDDVKLNEIIKIPFKISEIVKFLVVSTLIYLLVLTCFIILCFQAIEVDVIVEIILCFPIIHFLKSFPLSVSGWGIREIVTVYLFSYFNLSNEIALSISISLGVIILVASFYGLIISIPLNLKLKYQRS